MAPGELSSRTAPDAVRDAKESLIGPTHPESDDSRKRKRDEGSRMVVCDLAGVLMNGADKPRLRPYAAEFLSMLETRAHVVLYTSRKSTKKRANAGGTARYQAVKPLLSRPHSIVYGDNDVATPFKGIGGNPHKPVTLKRLEDVWQRKNQGRSDAGSTLIIDDSPIKWLLHREDATVQLLPTAWNGAATDDEIKPGSAFYEAVERVLAAEDMRTELAAQIDNGGWYQQSAERCADVAKHGGASHILASVRR